MNTLPKRWHLGEHPYAANVADKMVDKPIHWHSHFSLSMVTKGEAVQIINGQRYVLKKGSTVIISPIDFHQNIADEKSDVSALNLRFSDKVFYELLSYVCAFDDFPVIATLKDDDFKTAKTLFALLFKELDNNKNSFATEEFVFGIIKQLIILVLRARGNKNKITEIPPIRRALAFIQCNFRQNIKVSDLAAYTGYSNNYFSAKFKEETGIEFQKYLLELRLDFAKKLLENSDLTVTQACLEAGFNTLQHFSQAFKKRFGVSAKEYKNKKAYS